MRWRPTLLLVPLAASPLLAQVPMGPEFVVTTQGAPVIASRAAAAPDGRFVIVWSDQARDGSSFGVFGRAFGADGLPRGAEFQVNTYTTGYQTRWIWNHPAVSFGDDGFVVVWPSDGQDGVGWGVFGQRFDADGGRRGTEFQVNTETMGDQAKPSVAMARDGRFVVVWAGNLFQISGQRYDPNGNRLGGDFIVNSTPNGDLPEIAMDGSGNSVVVWSSWSCSILGQRFDAVGNRRGGEFQVKAQTSNPCPNEPQVAASPDGRFVVSWQSPLSGLDNVFAQRFDSAGNRVGYEFLVNTYTTQNHYSHRVAMDANGRFVVAWDSSSSGVHARAFDPEGEPSTPEFDVGHDRVVTAISAGLAAEPFGNFVLAWERIDYPPEQRSIRARRYYGGLVPGLLAVDASGGPGSDGNRVLEACETVDMRPSWLNETAEPLALDGALSDFTGPSGATYTIIDGSGSYSVGSGATATCQDCYRVGVSCASSRPALHWDATVTEAIAATPQRKPWSLHVGDSFADVPRTNPFYRFVETLLHQSVTAGCGASAYCPSASVSREQMPVFVLVAREGQGYELPPCNPPAPPFADVAWDSPFCRWISQLQSRGVVAGCGGGNYCPADPVTREQMAVFILRTLDPALSPRACTTPMFGDVPASSPFCPWIEELARRGAVAGCGGGNYCPSAPVTREQMAAFLSMAFGLTLYGPVP